MEIVHVGQPTKNLEVLGIKLFLILEDEVLKIEDPSSCHTTFTSKPNREWLHKHTARKSSARSKSIQQQINGTQRSIRTRTRELSVSQQITLGRFAVWTDWIKQETMSRAFPHNHTISAYLQDVLDIQRTQEPYDDDDNRIRQQKLNDLSWNYPTPLRYTSEIHGEWILQSGRR